VPDGRHLEGVGSEVSAKRQRSGIGAKPALRSREKKMKDGMWAVGVLIIWLVLQLWLLPKLGIPT